MRCQTNNFPSGIIRFLLLALLVTSCVEDEKPPKNTMSEEKMATILTDIHLAESRVNRLQLRSLDSSLMIFNKLKSDIWKKYKVDTVAYRKSYDYYMTRPETMTRIYEKVNKNVEIREKTNNIKL
ncbi:DUF4296 domain-containing protein [Dyadobacter fanqingshengii]|uniref:DUF4296 domain-containing protein n=1 Tax=Dyadobacter fanqingshengii TaxID=2906443 RepID=A0A9X1PGW6_9BACT|nr:DUF4296 domain-containing protein [Dyadobacter fanqingshengii]MCF0043508.1 DUF4296 domain-containing protein [Dyadobacter fanqingshengii]MCF2504145.1 DUF4296 domain-containing protein [Dyadobacter fanqingshengii]USJ34873.1 DUF4296 domain-containing protein [Dyadobacter fanqingshengii]